MFFFSEQPVLYSGWTLRTALALEGWFSGHGRIAQSHGLAWLRNQPRGFRRGSGGKHGLKFHQSFGNGSNVGKIIINIINKPCGNGL